MNKLLIAAMVSMALAGCGGGGSDTNTAAEPPAPEMPSGSSGSGSGSGGSDDDGGGAPPAEPVELAMSCSKQPSGTVNPGSDAKATFAVNKPINTKGILSMNCPGGQQNFVSKSVDVISGQALVKQSVPGGCTGSTLNMTLKLSDENLTATCSWPVNELQVLGFE